MRRMSAVLTAGLVWIGWQLAVTPLAWGEPKVSITGQIRFNVIYSDVIHGSTQTIPPGSIPFTSGPRKSAEADNSQTILDARRTRLQVDASDTAPGNIKLAARIQTDFDTTDGNALVSNSRHLRLRLAYGQGTTPGGFTLRAGQVRTLVGEAGDNLLGGVAFPEVVNEFAHWTHLIARQPGLQVAWTQKAAGGDFTIGAAVEKQAVGVKSRAGLSAAADERQGAGQDVPLFAAGVRYRSPLFSLFARGAVAKARVIFAGTGKDEDEAVWLGALGAEVKPTGLLTFYAQYWLSEGLNRLGGAAFNDVALVGGKLEAVETQAFHVGGQLQLAKATRFNVVYQWLKADDDPKIFDLGATSADKERFQALNVNLIHRFWTRWDTGIEYMWARVDSFGDSDGTANIVNFRLRFYF